MNSYVVIGIFKDTRQRYTDTFLTDTVAEAESEAREQAGNTLLIAATIEVKDDSCDLSLGSDEWSKCRLVG
jgi:hypothetical protein